MTTEIYAKARRHLSRRDPVLKNIISQVGGCTMQVDPEAFTVLCRSIVAQLISTKAARTIFARLEAAAGGPGFRPKDILKLPEETLRGCGLSGAKTAAIRDLATRAADGTLPLAEFPTMSDADVIRHLVEVRGIGVWTAEMFLIFSLGRLDVLPVGDLGLRVGVKDSYELDDLPAPKKLHELAAPWQPYRSVATWYFWRSRGFVPQSGE